MAISFVGGVEGSAASGGDPSLDLTALTGGSDSAPIEGDLVIVAYTIGDTDEIDFDMAMVTADYTQVADLFSLEFFDCNQGVFYKFMGSTPDTTAVADGQGGANAAVTAVVMVFRGVALVADGGPFDVAAVLATGLNTFSPDPPSIDHSAASGIWTVIAGGSSHTTGMNGSYTFPTGYTTNARDIGQNDTIDSTTGMGYRIDPADPEDPGVMTHSGTDSVTFGWCAVTMALKPAAGANEAAIAQTLPALTQDASATNLLEAALAQVLPALTQDAAATVLLEISSAQVLPALAQDVTAVAETGANEAIVDQTLPALTQDVNASVLLEAAVAQTLPGLTQAVTAEVLLEAVITQTLPALGQNVTAEVLIEAVITQTLPALIQDLTAQTTGPALAAIEQVLPTLTQAGAAEALVAAVVDQILPALGQSAEAEVLIEATVAQTLPALTQDATVFAPAGAADAEITQTLPALGQFIRTVRFNTGGGVEGFEVGYGPMGQGINRRRKDFATGKGRAVS